MVLHNEMNKMSAKKKKKEKERGTQQGFHYLAEIVLGKI